MGKKYIFGRQRNFEAIFWSFWVQNPKTLKHSGFIYQNKAYDSVFPKNLVAWSL